MQSRNYFVNGKTIYQFFRLIHKKTPEEGFNLELVIYSFLLLISISVLFNSSINALYFSLIVSGYFLSLIIREPFSTDNV